MFYIIRLIWFILIVYKDFNFFLCNNGCIKKYIKWLNLFSFMFVEVFYD